MIPDTEGRKGTSVLRTADMTGAAGEIPTGEPENPAASGRKRPVRRVSREAIMSERTAIRSDPGRSLSGRRQRKAPGISPRTGPSMRKDGPGRGWRILPARLHRDRHPGRKSAARRVFLQKRRKRLFPKKTSNGRSATAGS